MAGGSGTRFWPKSSKNNPKQFLPLTNSKSMIKNTFDRLNGVVGKKQRWVVCTENQKRQTKKELGSQTTVLAEPEGRNTMAAVCLSAWTVSKKDPDGVIAILPADHHIADIPGFKSDLLKAYSLAESSGRIVCLGIKPTFPSTGYGYIEAGENLGPSEDGSFKIKAFIEKPPLEQAKDLFEKSQFMWNAGIFVFSVSTFIAEVRSHAPEFASSFDKIKKDPKKLKSIYKKLSKLPVDVALMEKTEKGAVIRGDFGWNDVGSWATLEEVMAENSPAGVIKAKGGHVSLNSSGMIVDVTDDKFIGLVGVKDLIVVETKNSILICHKDKAQDIKNLVGEINKNKKWRNKFL